MLHFPTCTLSKVSLFVGVSQRWKVSWTQCEMMLSREEAFSFAGILLAIFVCGLVGNFLVCLAIYFDKDLRQQHSNYFLFNLAVTDLLTVIFVIPFCAAALIQGNWNYGNAWCQATAFVYYSLAIVGLENLAFISWDRFYAIIYPLKYRAKVTPRRIYVAIAFSWIWAFIFTIPCAAMGWFRYGEYESMCTYNFTGTGNKWKIRVVIYSVLTITLCIMIPSAVILFCYFRIISVVRHQGRRVDTITSREMTNSNNSRRQAWRSCYRFKGFRTITAVIILFIISWTPFSATRFIKTVTWDHEYIPAAADTFATVLSLFSTAANPLAYSLFRRDFRRAFKRLLRRICCCAKRRVDENEE